MWVKSEKRFKRYRVRCKECGRVVKVVTCVPETASCVCGANLRLVPDWLRRFRNENNGNRG